MSVSPERVRTVRDRIALARSSRTCAERLEQLVEFPETHRALAGNPRIPEPILALLAANADPKVLRRLTQNYATPRHLLNQIAEESTDPAVLQSLLRRENLPDLVVNTLTATGDDDLKQQIASRESLPAETLMMLATDVENHLRWKAVKHAGATAEVLDLLARDPDQGFSARAAEHDNVSRSTLTRLAGHADPIVRAAVAKAPSTSETALRQLIRDPNPMVRHAVLSRVKCSRSLLRQALKDEEPSIMKQAAELLADRWLSPVVESKLLRSRDPWLRVLVAQKGCRDAAGRLATDGDLLVRIPALQRGALRRDAIPAAAESDDPYVIDALLRNSQALPKSLLATIARHVDPSVRRRLATRRDYDRQTLRLLANDEECRVRSAVARNPATPKPILATLLHDGDLIVQRAAASNRKTSTMDAPDEGVYAPQAAADESLSIDRQLKLATNGDHETRMNLARNPACCIQAQYILATTADSGVRYVLGDQEHVGPEILEVLGAVDGDYGAHIRMGHHDALSPELRRKLVEHPAHIVRTVVAQRADLDDHELAILAADPSSDVRRWLAANPETPAEHLFTLAHPVDARVRFSVSTHENADERVLDLLATDVSEALRQDLTHRVQDLNDATKARLSTGHSYKYRLRLAKDPDADPDLLDAWADGWIGSVVVENDRTPQTTLERLLTHPYWFCRKEAVKRRDHLTDEQCIAAATDVSWFTRRTVAERPDAPTAAVDLLIADRDWSVRAAVAAHRNITPAHLVTLAEDQIIDVRRAVAGNPMAPSQAIETLLLQEDSTLTAKLAAHPNVGAEYLRSLVKTSSHQGVLAGMARNPNAPEDVLAELAEHPNSYIARTVARHEKAPPALLEQLARSTESSVRAAVAANSTTPIDVLVSLTDDEDTHVRKAVAHNRNTPAAERVLAALL